MPWVEKERTALVATLRASDPDGPTLCEGWNVRRLLAHLVQREHDLVGGVRDIVSRAEPGREKNLSTLTDGARTPEGYQALVGRFSEGPPRWSPMSWAGENINLLEYVIHHEDVRRAGSTPAAPRPLPDAESQSIWSKLLLVARLTFRASPVGVILAQPGGQSSVVKNGVVKNGVVKKGEPSVTLTGAPVELALYLNGRRTSAAVEVTGPPDAVLTFTSWLTAR